MHAHEAETRMPGAGHRRGRRPEPTRDPGTPVRGLLALQRSAGNRAVTAAIQRDEDEVGAGAGPLRAAIRRRRAARQRVPVPRRVVPRCRPLARAVHTGAAAAESARSVDSHAYTSGSDIVFGAGMYDTASTGGQARLAHELTHVVQQQRGPVAGTTTTGGLSISDPADRFEREAEAAGAAFAAQPLQREMDEEL